MRSYKNDPQNNRGNNRANDACGLNDGVARSFGPGKKARGMENSRRATEGNLHWLDNASMPGLISFIQERESIRIKKEAGEPRPWTDDEVLDKSKFCNIRREDDKTSKFIFESVKGLTGVELTYNLVLSRLINRIDVLSKVLPTTLSTDLSFLLDGEGVVMNPKAYQISPGVVLSSDYETIREVIVHEVSGLIEGVHQALFSTTDLNEAVELANKAMRGHLRFAMMQVALDIQHLIGFYNSTKVTPGQGARLVVDKLGGLAEVVESTGLNEIDAEHACCEYRKYLYRQDKILSRYSYVPNSMGLESKNNAGED